MQEPVTEPLTEPLLVTDGRLLDHAPSGGYPEAPERLRWIIDALGQGPGRRWAEVAAAAPRDALLRVHSPAHLARLEGLAGADRWITGDTAVSPGTVAAAGLAAGAGIAAVDALLGGRARRAFCVIRPPGHHAKRERMMGFCFLNNIAVAAAHALEVHGLQRVMIVDWDVHHGNGTEAIFYGDPRVLVVDSHQAPFYPGTGELNRLGEGAAVGTTVNLPLPAGTGDGDVVAIYRGLLPELAASFEPELILVSAGFDAHRDDPIGGLEMTEGGFASLTALVCALAERHCAGRVALFLEGGYDLQATAASVVACVDVLGGAVSELDKFGPLKTAGAAPGPIARALLPIFRSHHGLYWPRLR